MKERARNKLEGDFLMQYTRKVGQGDRGIEIGPGKQLISHNIVYIRIYEAHHAPTITSIFWRTRRIAAQISPSTSGVPSASGGKIG